MLSMEVANMDLTIWPVSSSSRRGGDGLKELVVVERGCCLLF